MKTLTHVALALTTLVTACSYNPAPVPVRGSSTDLAALAGEWRGEYESAGRPDRFGSILFRLSAGRDTAYGDVIMVAHPRNQPPRVLSTEPPPFDRDIPGGYRLSIAFVEAADGTVTGVLAPYTDPLCGCTLRTTFTGRVRGDEVEGTFTSLHLDTGMKTGGSWRATRRKS